MTERIGNWLIEHVGLHESKSMMFAIIGICIVMVALSLGNVVRIAIVWMRGPKRKPADPHADIRAIAARETGNPYQSPLTR